MRTKICRQCGNLFKPPHGKRDKFCSQRCYGDSKQVNSLKIDSDKKTGCWNWLMNKSDRGYGLLKVKGKSMRAHRYFYEKYKGNIPDGKIIDHLCKNTSCVNPEHLEVVTVAENTRRGKLTRLNKSIISRIIDIYKKNKLTQAEIGRMFGVDPSHVSRIVRGLAWVH